MAGEGAGLKRKFTKIDMNAMWVWEIDWLHDPMAEIHQLYIIKRYIIHVYM